MKKMRDYFDKLVDDDIQREEVEWSNVWIDRVHDRESKRYLLIGDSVLRMVRSSIAAKLDSPIDFIGCSSPLNDVLFVNLVDYFFQTTSYQYAGVVIQVNHHGTVGLDGGAFNESDYKVYHDSLSCLVEFIKQYTFNVVLVNVLDFYTIKPKFKCIPVRLRNALYRWKILKEKKDDFRTGICHCRNIEIKQVALENKIKFLDLNQVIANHKIIRVDRIHPEYKAVPIMADSIVEQIHK